MRVERRGQNHVAGPLKPANSDYAKCLTILIHDLLLFFVYIKVIFVHFHSILQ